MQAAQTKPTSALRLTVLFTASFILMVALFMAIVYIAATYFNFPIENSAMGVMVMVVAGMSTGTTWFTRDGQKPSSGRKWQVALLSALVVLCVQAGLLGLAIWADPRLKVEIAREGTQFLAIIAAAALVFNLLAIRVGLWLGISSASKRAETLAQAGR